MSRKLGECIVIDNNVRVTIVEIRGDKVRLGIEAPREMSVHRQEVFDALIGQRADTATSVYAADAGAKAVVDRPIALSDRYTVDHQFVLRFHSNADHAAEVREFLTALGVAVRMNWDGSITAVLDENQHRRLSAQFRFCRPS